MTRLERRCRLLLRAYPAAYRREHGAEILGTLVEVTPTGRSLPSLRDGRSVVVGGLRARAALNRRLPMGSSLRLAAFFGLSVYLASVAGAELSGFAYARLAPYAAPVGWLALPTGLLMAAIVVLAWLAPRMAVIAAVPAAGAATASYGFSSASGSWRATTPTETFVILASLAALAALAARADRPPRPWLWLVGLAAAAPAVSQLPDAVPSATFLVSALPWVTMFMVAVSIAWLAVDARPAAGLAAYLALLGLPTLAPVLQLGEGLQTAAANARWLDLGVVLAVPVLWRLQRQAALM